MELALKLSGILLGVLARSLIPYLRKLKQGKVARFSRRYFSTAIASVILGVIVTLIIFPQFKSPSAEITAEGYIKLFCASFGFGFGWNTIINEITKWSFKCGG